ncbi:MULTISPECIES: hypothetical protein [Cohnella]|uniref:hypothetical protein n=1 Tax=Cohnella TaxID=329857 RepID=UPI0009B9CB72|nr:MULTISPECIES: hypothetical protein [Cohnella]MBN2983448.1 hypothetical protein [Cohnella algarum]
MSLHKRCPCGHGQQLTLRTVLHARKASIANVPVYSCDECGRNEVFPGVKAELGRLIGELGPAPRPQTVLFDERHEWVGVLAALHKRERRITATAVARRTEERMDELLDLLLVASNVGDEQWKTELNGRLSQLSSQYICY